MINDLRAAIRRTEGATLGAMGESWTSTAWVAAVLSISKAKARTRLRRLWRRGLVARSRHREKVAAIGRREFTWHKR